MALAVTVAVAQAPSRGFDDRRLCRCGIRCVWGRGSGLMPLNATKSSATPLLVWETNQRRSRSKLLHTPQALNPAHVRGTPHTCVLFCPSWSHSVSLPSALRRRCCILRRVIDNSHCNKRQRRGRVQVWTSIDRHSIKGVTPMLCLQATMRGKGSPTSQPTPASLGQPSWVGL